MSHILSPQWFYNEKCQLSLRIAITAAREQFLGAVRSRCAWRWGLRTSQLHRRALYMPSSIVSNNFSSAYTAATSGIQSRRRCVHCPPTANCSCTTCDCHQERLHLPPIPRILSKMSGMDCFLLHVLIAVSQIIPATCTFQTIVTTRRVWVSGSCACTVLILALCIPFLWPMLFFLCTPAFKDAHHYCPNCLTLLSVRRRWTSLLSDHSCISKSLAKFSIRFTNWSSSSQTTRCGSIIYNMSKTKNFLQEIKRFSPHKCHSSMGERVWGGGEGARARLPLLPRDLIPELNETH